MVALKDDLVTQAVSGSYGEGSIRRNAVVATTDATVTVLASIPLAVLEAVVVEAVVVGARADFAAGIFRTITGGFRRATAGNVTAIGAVTGADVEDSAGTPVITLAANTTAQTVELRVTGIVGENWKWEAKFNFHKIR